MRKYFMLVAVIFLSSFKHPIHVSVCDIEFDKERNALEIVQRIFLDDLELAVRNQQGDQMIDLLSPKGTTTDNLVKAYLKAHFKISVNNKAETYSYLGHEVEGDALYAYMEIEKVKKLNSIQVYSAILTREHDDQVNLVHVEVDKKIKSLKLTNSNKTDQLEY
ncbi:hypothetical protein JMN32_08290 [Fulvivirga sp. 29W222]|uniref:Uncharacterized protein n=1 Tax=Fulvivirga marina TaxID=2494733 RepID=A0A937FUR8_9BACT|nr:DUF6702 family protein [Fulvivirga marina]MBL6446304.1 hypothetical protein [Fulvivirga marina]